ncbi:MAG TPA: EAL domain-containing protein [Rhodocyclaceae bacterium]|nr:EAL domain-containing protein [Rhodocyclaceae bacterium]
MSDEKNGLPDDPYHLIVERVPLGLVMTDAEGTITYVNPRACETSGYSPEELIGHNARIFSAGATPQATYRQMWATISAGRIWHGHVLNRCKNGSTVTEYMQVSPLRDDAGRITHYLAVKEEKLVRPESRFARRTATLDPLTGLPSRSELLQQLEEMVGRVYESGAGFALLYLHLDQFRNLYQTSGPIAADKVMLEVVARLSTAVRADDLIARCASDEFAVVLNDSSDEAICRQATHRLLQALAAPITVDGHMTEMTCTTGVARFPLDGETADELLRAALLALSAATRDGGSGLRFFTPELATQDNSELDITSLLRYAVERGELRLHYQPQLSLRSGQVVGVEALVRWQHPVKGLIPPGLFIPIAEDTGLIIGIGEWVMREACRQVKEWQSLGLSSVHVAVNLSARHFHSSTLPDTVASVLADTGLEAKYLELELTESAIMQDTAKAVRVVDRLKNLGVHISLDDFGTGYSSLAYLSRFQIDRLKIDQSFVRDITTNPVNASIATATIAMAHKLGKIVVAEGVETQAQMEFLRRGDCDEMQGYYFSRPVPAEELGQILRSGKHLDLSAEASATQTDTILLVDDEPNILNALRRLLRREGYRILTASGGAEGLELLALHAVQVIVSDQRMPGMSGVEFLSKVKELYPQTVRMSLSGYSEISTVTDAINKGAIWKYITKPWDDEALVKEIRDAFRLARPAT